MQTSRIPDNISRLCNLPDHGRNDKRYTFLMSDGYTTSIIAICFYIRFRLLDSLIVYLKTIHHHIYVRRGYLRELHDFFVTRQSMESGRFDFPTNSPHTKPNKIIHITPRLRIDRLEDRQLAAIKRRCNFERILCRIFFSLYKYK